MIMDLFFDGRECKDRAQTHELLKNLLQFPAYYGKNLDALYDCASTLQGVRLHILYWNAMVEQWGHYGHLILQTLSEAAEENVGFELILEELHEDDVEI